MLVGAEQSSGPDDQISQYFNPYEGEISNNQYGFKVADINLLIDNQISSEVIAKTTIYILPNTPRWVIGLINFRGNIVPVIDIYKHLSPDYDLGKSEHVLVIDKGERACAIQINELPVSVNREQLKRYYEVPNELSEVLKRNIMSVYTFNNSIWIEPNFDSLFMEIMQDFIA